MKKFYSFLFVCMAALVTGLYLISCSKDDDTAGDDSLIGTWVSRDDDSYSGSYEEYIMFCPNGTAYSFEIDGREVDVIKATYVYNEETGKLITVEEDGYTQTVTVLAVDKHKLIINMGGKESVIWNRTSSPYSESELEKMWKENNSYYDSY